MSQVLKLKKASLVAFLNKDIFYVDVKMVRLDRVLTNLFLKIYANGAPISPNVRRGGWTIENIESILGVLENRGEFIGITENKKAVEDWLRSSLLELVNRGNVVKEHVATLKPLHLLSWRLQNPKYCRDYRASDQLYLMLNSEPSVMAGLASYLSKGWDKHSGSIISSENLDVDTTGILYLTAAKEMKEKNSTRKEIEETPKPFLKKQASLFCDDIRKLLLYKDVLPRTVFIDYLRILCGFHLSLYIMKLIYFLPKMVAAGKHDIEDDWSMVVDVTDDLDSPVSTYACQDMEKTMNGLGRYIRSTYMIDYIQKRRKCTVDQAIHILKNENDVTDGFYEANLNNIRDGLPESSETEFDQNDFHDMLELFSENDYFDKLIHILETSNLGASQFRYTREFIDAVSMKNSSSKLLADSRSRRHPRRGALGSKLLETLVQLLVIHDKPTGGYETRSLSIDELVEEIRKRYGLIINGLAEPRFANSGVEANEAFRVNMEAFKDKLRQIGFYTDMSDAYILQKIRPRYKLESK